MENLAVRPFRTEDAAATAKIFFEAVHFGTTEYYDEQQRCAWAENIPSTTKWRDRLNSQKTFVAETGNKLVGFMTLAVNGYIDLAYVAPEAIGKGVAKALYDVVEREASQSGTQRLHSEASHLARSFFERQCWSVVKEQVISRGDVTLTNFIMEKHLN